MKIKTEHIGDSPKSIKTSESASYFPALASMAESGECEFTGKVESELLVSREADQFRVDGKISVPVSLCCSRCLKQIDQQIVSCFTIYFRNDSLAPELAEDEVELAERDLVSTTFTGDELDLAPEIGEQVALEIPLKPLCSEGCKGLCTSCGADLNKVSCSCNVEEFPHKFSALKDFKVNRK